MLEMLRLPTSPLAFPSFPLVSHQEATNLVLQLNSAQPFHCKQHEMENKNRRLKLKNDLTNFSSEDFIQD